MAPSQAKNCVNTSVSASKSCQNTAIFTVFRAFHVCLKLQKHCKYRHFLRSTRDKCCNLQCFFCLAFKNTGMCSVLCISGPKSIGIYSIFCVFAWLPPTTLKRKNDVIYSILWLPKIENSSEKCVNVSKRHFIPILGHPKRIFKFHPLFVHPRPRKTWKPQHPEGFSKRSAAPACPRVAKAMLSFHHRLRRRCRI